MDPDARLRRQRVPVALGLPPIVENKVEAFVPDVAAAAATAMTMPAAITPLHGSHAPAVDLHALQESKYIREHHRTGSQETACVTAGIMAAIELICINTPAAERATMVDAS